MSHPANSALALIARCGDLAARIPANASRVVADDLHLAA
jgi:hypothetical protein